jgi:hypothetical protein
MSAMTLSRLIASLVALMLANGALAESIATIEVTDGTVFVTRNTGKRGIVAAGSQLAVGDTITTEKESYARLRFTDGGVVAVRPVSSLQVNDYHFEEFRPSKDGLVMRLLKGGIRNLTGLIGKRGYQSAYRLDGVTATIGVRGTDFIARTCESDCGQEKYAAENTKKQIAPPSANPIVGRLYLAQGQTMVTSVGGQPRVLNVGDPVYLGNTVESAAPGFATLVMSDETRIVLNAGSHYTVTTYRYNAKVPESGNMLTNLVKGGIRVVTGLVGRRKPEKVTFNTVTATIGIRGTNFDIRCAPSGSGDSQAYDPVVSGPVSCDQALYASTRDGEIEIRSGQFKLLVPKGQTGYVDAPGAIPVLLSEMPGFMRDNPAPKPELLDIDFGRLFGRDGSDMSEPGLYVEVKEGRVALTQPNGQQIEIKTGETGFAGPEGTQLYKMGTTPSFLEDDRYLRDLHVDPMSCRAQ